MTDKSGVAGTARHLPVSHAPSESTLPSNRQIYVRFERLPQPEDNHKVIVERLPSVETSDCVQHERFVLQRLLTKLKNTFNLELEGMEIEYYLQTEGCWLQCGRDPLCADVTLTLEEYSSSSTIQLRARQVAVSAHQTYLQRLVETEVDEYHAQEMIQLVTRQEKKKQTQQTGHAPPKKGPKKIKKGKNRDDDDEEEHKKRMNERPIGYVVDKVAEWRKIFIDGRSNERLSLVEAAELVGISKKSLDDYTLHIRKGFKYFFNFNENRHSKIGVLRDFVKKHEQAVKEEEEQIRELSLKKKQSLRPSSSTTSKNNRGPPTGKS